jgi:acetoin:2,6-dichlorophenolindophenol oxidoreductase subunit alpha
MAIDLWPLYGKILFSRFFEEAIIQLWNDGLISGEMHLGIGEEAIVAGICDHLVEGDSLALDHRCTPPFLMRGVDPVSILRECLGDPEGLCNGMGGHMHLFSRENLMASSGIVGSSGPSAAGFALAAQHLRPDTVAIAFFGEGALNQGMLMESMNLAVAWNLPVIFVCKDNDMAITTVSSSVSGGAPVERAQGFGMTAVEVDGSFVEEVWETAGDIIKAARGGNGPGFIHAHCFHSEGHFLGDPLIRITRDPLKEMTKITGPLLKSSAKIKGASPLKRFGSLGAVMSVLGRTAKEQLIKQKDPVDLIRKTLKIEKGRLKELEESIKREIEQVIATALRLTPEKETSS